MDAISWRVLENIDIYFVTHQPQVPEKILLKNIENMFTITTLRYCVENESVEHMMWCVSKQCIISIQSPHEPITMSHLYTLNRGGRHHTAITTIYSIKIIIITTGRYHQPVLGEGENNIWFNHFSVKILITTIIWYIYSVWSCMKFLTWILTTNENQNMKFNNLIKLSLVAC